MTAAGDIFDNLEDPAQHWVDLVGAYREHDLNGVRRLILVAKKSLWTEKLWKEEMGPVELGQFSEPDVEPEEWSE